MPSTHIYFGSDHAGFELKQALIAKLTELGHHCRDLGPATSEPVDYPQSAARVATTVVGRPTCARMRAIRPSIIAT